MSSERTSHSSHGIHWGLAQKVGIVTGASSGIGAGIAATLASSGARVVTVGRNVERLAARAHDIRASGGECLELAVDVRETGAPERILTATLDRFGSIDFLVNNAGIFTSAMLADTTPEEFDGQYDTNVRAPFMLTRAVAPAMRRGGAIVFVGSNLVHRGLAGMVAYSASKGAVEAMAKTLAVEFAPAGIRVNTVSPGVTRTPMTDGFTSDADVEAAVESATPLGRLGVVPDIADAVAYLCSDAAAYLVGATLIVDGGVTAS